MVTGDFVAVEQDDGDVVLVFFVIGETVQNVAELQIEGDALADEMDDIERLIAQRAAGFGVERYENRRLKNS